MKGYGVPEIFENEATNVIKPIYADIKNVLKVPMVNFIFRTLAYYDQFLALGWRQVRSNMLTVNAERAAALLRYPHLSVSVSDIQWNKYYNPQTLDTIRRTVAMFNYVNPKLLLIASAWSESLSDRPNPGDQAVKGMIKPGVRSEFPSIEMVHIPEAKPPVQSLLLDIIRKHQTFDAASDFRVLASYPQFLKVAWSGLRPYVGSDEFALLSEKLKSQAVHLTKEFPYPVTVSRRQLETMYSEAEIAGIMGIVSMFQDFLPGLMIDGEYFRKILLV